MFLRISVVLALLVLLASSAFAVVDLSSDAGAGLEMPLGLSAEFRSDGIFISWQHAGGQDVSFKVYRGLIGNPSKVIAVTNEKSFFDSTAEAGQEYEYSITAFDATDESIGAGFTITNPVAEEKPFVISLVEPKNKTFAFGEEIEFVVKVESQRFDELQNLEVVLINQELGTTRAFSFDSERKEFVLLEKLPEAKQGRNEGFSTAYSILASASLEGEQFSELETYVLTLVPVKELDSAQFALNILAVFGLPFLLLMLASTVAFVGWRWSLQRKTVRDRLKLELLEIEKERHLWKYEVFRRKITSDQFREKESELQSKQAVVEGKLGRRVEKTDLNVNTFQGFSTAEVREIMMLVKTIKKPKKGQTEDSLRARLVGLGRSEKVAKKVARLVFEK